jgi:hypothetical protein
VPGGAAEWIAGFPPEVRAQFPVSDVDAGTVKAATDALSHPWMTLGQVIDPTLMGSEPDEGNKLNYWAFRTFTQRTVHLPLLFSLKLARQIDVWERLRGQPAFPVTLGPYGGSTDVHPLFAKALQSHAGLTVAVPPGRAQSARLNRFKSNLLRMQLLLREEQLRAGAAIPTNQGNDHCESVTCEVSALRGFPQEIIALSQQPGVQAAWEAEGFDVALAGQGTLMLLDSVSALLSTAPRR